VPTFDPPPIPLARTVASIRVARYDTKLDAGERYTDLPNIRCVEIQSREGPEPGVALFRYVFDQNTDAIYPRRVEEVLALSKAGPYVVRQDDRIVVLKDDVDGGSTVLFDGFAQAPQANLHSTGESVIFQCQGVAVREWDTPIGGAYYRDSDDPTDGADILTGLPTRFNPDGKPNCIPDGGNSGTSPKDYPAFFDVFCKKSTDVRTKWYLSKAIRYLCSHGNPDETYVKNPAFTVLDDLFSARTPKEGEFLDLNDSSTYDEAEIVCQDFDATGEPWPVAVTKLIEPHGFGLIFRLSTNTDGEPTTKVDLVRRDGGDAIKPKSLLLQEPGDTLAPDKSNLGSLTLSRDSTAIVNRFILDSEPTRYEADFVLAPAFAIDAGDATAVAPFGIGAASFADPTLLNSDKYRIFVFDECGEGHWNFLTATTATTVASLDAVLGIPSTDPVTGTVTRLYAHRRRPAIRDLVTVDHEGKTMEAMLWVSTDYAGTKPGVWDGTGTWQRVVSTEWTLLKDRLGIRLTMRNPDDWSIGKPTDASMPFPSGKVRVVKSLASADSTNPRFHFRLTCTIEGDQNLSALASKRAASSTKFSITRRHDARDRFRKRVVTMKSHFNTTNANLSPIDDTEKAKAHVEALRLSHEAARFAGSPVVPRFTLAYRLGDKLDRVKGREISFETVIGREQQEGARYPTVVGITWSFDGQQQTTLHLEDRRAEPPSRRSR